MKSTTDDIKLMVKEKYAEIANQDRAANAASCCGSGCCSTIDAAIMAEDYTALPGYAADADLGLGCGLPTEFAQIKAGDVVVDLGSGAGNDCFVARAATGPAGKVIGVDMTEAMIDRARANAEKLGYNNVEFRLGDIEHLPITAGVADVVVSNCVLNLVPDKTGVLRETYRVLKAGGHFSISDIVLEGELPEQLMHVAEMYAGCITGAIQKEQYLALIREAGFTNIVVQKEKQIVVPDDILNSYLTVDGVDAFKNSRILSVTVYAEKPEKKNCCGPDCCS